MSSKTLYSINLADRYTDKDGNEQTSFRQVSIGFSNKKSGLSFKVPKGLALTADAEIVIFPIEHDKA